MKLDLEQISLHPEASSERGFLAFPAMDASGQNVFRMKVSANHLGQWSASSLVNRGANCGSQAEICRPLIWGKLHSCLLLCQLLARPGG